MKKITLAITVITLLFITSNFSSAQDTNNQVVVLSAGELKKMVDDQANFILIDARSQDDFKKEHLVNAINITPEQANAQSLGQVAPDVDTKLVFYCTDVNCTASAVAAHKAIGAGYKYVYRYSGGITDWKTHNYPITQ